MMGQRQGFEEGHKLGSGLERQAGWRHVEMGTAGVRRVHHVTCGVGQRDFGAKQT